ncbi:MAG: hypothetical protein ACOCQD_01395 [archaeon]
MGINIISNNETSNDKYRKREDVIPEKEVVNDVFPDTDKSDTVDLDVDNDFYYGQPQTGEDFIYDFNTTNKTFIAVHNVLKEYGIKNNKFFLVLYDKDLIGVDPHDPDLSIEMQSKIVQEVQRNFWYYIREVVILQTEGGRSRFMLHIGNLAAAFLKLQNLNYYWEQPRQTGKTLGEMCFESYFFAFGCINTEFGFYCYDNNRAKDNLQTVIGVLDNLPEYLKIYNLKKKVDNATGQVSYKDRGEAGKKIKSHENSVMNNKAYASTTGQTKQSADKAGRGATQAKMNFDEFGWSRFNYMVWGAASYAHTTAAKNAERAGKPYGVSFTSTPPDMSTKEGEFLFDFVKRKSAPFEMFMFDMSRDDMVAWLKANAKKDFFYISFQYYELGYTEEWARDQWRQCATVEDYRRDVLLEWRRDLSSSPYGQVALNKIENLVKEVEYESIILHNKYHFKVYPGFEMGRFKNIVVGIDVGTGMGGKYDSSTMVGIDPDTTEVLFTFKSNEADTSVFSALIYEFTTTYLNNCVLVIERNSVGKAIIDNLKDTDIRDYLYYSPFSDRHEIQGATPEVVTNGQKHLFGIINRTKIRDRLFEIMSTRVREYKRLFMSKDIYDEITDLVEKKGKIQHKDGAHDDLVIAYLFALYVLMRDTELYDNFGISKPNPPTDKENQERYDMDTLGVNNDDDINIFVTDSTTEENKVKTMEEFLKEREEESFRQKLRRNNEDVPPPTDKSGFIDLSDDMFD